MVDGVKNTGTSVINVERMEDRLEITNSSDPESSLTQKQEKELEAKKKELKDIIEGKGLTITDEELTQFASKDASKLKKIVKTLQYGDESIQDKFNILKGLINIENRRYQFTSEELASFAKLNNDQLTRVNYLSYIAKRGDTQFDGDEILALAKLDDSKYEDAMTLIKNVGNKTINIDNSGYDYMINGHDIKDLVNNLDDEQRGRAETLLEIG